MIPISLNFFRELKKFALIGFYHMPDGVNLTVIFSSSICLEHNIHEAYSTSSFVEWFL